MSPYQKKQRDKRRKNLFRKWHRRVGFASLIFMLNLAITGVFLNHSDDFSLHNKFLSSDWLIELYGVKAPAGAKCFASVKPDEPVCQLGERIYQGHHLLLDDTNNLIGLVESQGLYYLATSNEILIYTDSFELVENLEQKNGLPTPIDALFRVEEQQEGMTVSNIYLSSNNQLWKLDQQSAIWSKSDQLIMPRITALKISESKLDELQDIYLDSQITYLKFMQDLHSGRIFSLAGKIITDLVAFVIIVLAISGFFAWQRRKQKIN